MIEKLATVLPVSNVALAANAWSELLGAAPTFVDGDRWAQFDVGGGRLALAGIDRTSDDAGLMVKVADVEIVHQKLSQNGRQPTSIASGPHERRFTVAGPGGVPVTFYQPD